MKFQRLKHDFFIILQLLGLEMTEIFADFWHNCAKTELHSL